MTDTTLTAVGFGYTHSNPPEVIIELPPFQTDKVTSINNVEGFTGIITGITTTTTNSGAQAALKFFFRATKTVQPRLQPGYPVFIRDTSVGHGVTSVFGHNSSVVGIGTTFLDNVYQVASVSSGGGIDGEIICNVENGSNIGGISTAGFHYPGPAAVSYTHLRAHET